MTRCALCSHELHAEGRNRIRLDWCQHDFHGDCYQRFQLFTRPPVPRCPICLHRRPGIWYRIPLRFYHIVPFILCLMYLLKLQSSEPTLTCPVAGATDCICVSGTALLLWSLSWHQLALMWLLKTTACRPFRGIGTISELSLITWITLNLSMTALILIASVTSMYVANTKDGRAIMTCGPVIRETDPALWGIIIAAMVSIPSLLITVMLAIFMGLVKCEWLVW